MKSLNRSKEKKKHVIQLSVLKFSIPFVLLLGVFSEISVIKTNTDENNVTQGLVDKQEAKSNSIPRITVIKNAPRPGVAITATTLEKETKSSLTTTAATVGNTTTTEPLPFCTSEQKKRIRKQLTPNKCRRPFNAFEQKCSLTTATKCPKPTWLTSYYKDLKRNQDEEFVAIYVGCNKGYDAVNALRMGTGNAKYSKMTWGQKFKETYESVCNQNEEEFTDVVSGDSVVKGHVHCIEPMPKNFKRLELSANGLAWNDVFLVTQAAIARENGKMYFLDSLYRTGRENVGLQNSCKHVDNKNHPNYAMLQVLCKKVHVYTLDHYLNNVAKKKPTDIIHILSIDVEGFDFDVILGGLETLSKTAYLEFEYNWMGSWKSQKLLDAIKLLNQYDFTCYWAGTDKLWRLDERCWLRYYNYHTWSNVACVNRKLNSAVAKNMEEIFQRTLQEDISY